MYSFKLIYFLIFILNLYRIACQISDKRLCYDEKCSVPLSAAKTLILYSAPDPRLLSFNPHEDVIIYSKEAGSVTELWGAEIRGKRGYLNKKFVRENQIFNKPTIIVDTEPTQIPQVPSKHTKDIKPDNVKQPHEVIDGTTLYDYLYDSTNPSTTENPSLSGSEDKDKLEENLPQQAKDESVFGSVMSSISDMLKDNEKMDDEVDIEDDDDDDDGEDDEDDVDDVDGINTKPDVPASSNDMHLEKNFKIDTPKMESTNDSKDEQKVSGKSVGNNDTVSSPSTEQIPRQKSEQEPIDSKDTQNVGDKSVENNVTVSNPSMERIPRQKSEQEPIDSKDTQKVGDTSVGNNDTVSSPSTEQIRRQKSEQEPIDSKDTQKVGDKSVENNDTVSNPSTERIPLQKSEQKPIDSKVDQKVGDKALENNDTVSSPSGEQIPHQKNEQNPVVYSENVESTTTQTLIEEIPPPTVNYDEVTPNPAEMEREVYEVKSHSQPATKSDPKLIATKPSSSVTIETVGQASSEQVPQSPKEEDGVPKLDLNLSVKIENQKSSGKTELNSEPQLIPGNVDGDGTKVSATLQEKTVDPNTTNTNEAILSSTKLDDLAVVETSNNTSSSQLEQSDQDKIRTEPKLADPTVFKDSASLREVKVAAVQENRPTLEDVPKLSVFGNLFGNQAAPSESVVGQHSEETSTLQLDSATSVSQDDLPKIEDVPVSNDVVAEEGTTSEAAVANFEGDANENGANEPPEDNLPAVEELPNAVIISTEEETTGDVTVDTNEVSNDNSGFLANLYSFFQSFDNDPSSDSDPHSPPLSRAEETLEDNVWAPPESCTRGAKEDSLTDVIFGFNSDFLLYLVTTAVSCIVFLFVYLAIDRNRREAPLVARINKLEKDLQVCLKENELLQERTPPVEENRVPNEVVEELQWKLSELQGRKSHLELQVTHLQAEVGKKAALEEQIESLEKELETSTEVGMELNRIISEMLDPTNGSDKLKENMDQLQRQLLEQKDTINKLSGALSAKEIENCALHDDLQDGKRRSDELRQRFEDVCEKLSTVQSETGRQRDAMQKDVALYRQKYDDAFMRNEQLSNEIQVLKLQLSDLTRQAELRTKEYDTLKESIGNIKSVKGEAAIRSLLDSTSMTAQLEQLKSENERFLIQTRQDQLRIGEYERKYRSVQEDVDTLTRRYEEADKDKTEANMKLEVLNNYFKKRESELQEEVLKYKSIFDAKEGAATSTSERMKLLQEEIENYKSQNETLKQEIISQEIDLKSQISVLEKKVHENWVTARQTERKLEDSRHEAAQLRNRLTLQNRGGFDDMRTQNRVQSPVDQNGDTTLSPHPSIESPASPPLLYSGREHITKSPPLPALPPPFLPPPPGAPFMPPPLPGMPHFMPPPPAMFPGDHRPPPLGRMSSPPPLNSRYSPGPMGFSPYDRNSPSPPYDSEYGTSPPVRGYSPFNGRDDRRDYKRPPPSRNKGRSMKGSTMSSGSEHSNDSLDKMNRKQSKMV